VKIAILNRSTVLTDAAVQAALPAFSHYGALVAAAWSLRQPTLYFTATPAASDWQIVILDDADQAGALGYHDFTVGGKPLAKVFAKTDLRYGASWTVTLTHELAEMQADPWINAAVQTSDSRFYALEIGDPVEDDSLAFSYTTLAGLAVKLSDFVLPAWFQPGAAGPYSHARHCSRPLQVLAGGYAQYFENGSWNQVGPNGQHQPMDPDDQRLRTRW
jgi:hypothetical protein